MLELLDIFKNGINKDEFLLPLLDIGDLTGLGAGNEECLRELIAGEYFDPNFPFSTADGEGIRPIHFAATRADWNGTVMEALLNRKDLDITAEVLFPTGHTYSCLKFAVLHANLFAVRAILGAAKWNMNAQDSRGLTMPIVAVASPGLKESEVRFGGGYKINTAEIDEDEAAQILSLLLAHPSANINATDSTGRTVLSWAASGGLFLGKPLYELHYFVCTWPVGFHLDMVLDLLKHDDIEPNLADLEGLTPLDYAKIAVTHIRKQKPIMAKDFFLDKNTGSRQVCDPYLGLKGDRGDPTPLFHEYSPFGHEELIEVFEKISKALIGAGARSGLKRDCNFYSSD